MSNAIVIKNSGFRDWVENWECCGTWSDDDNAYFENEADFNASMCNEIMYSDKSKYIYKSVQND